MIYVKIESPSEDVAHELKKLTEEYLNQFSGDDVYPKMAYTSTNARTVLLR